MWHCRIVPCILNRRYIIKSVSFQKNPLFGSITTQILRHAVVAHGSHTYSSLLEVLVPSSSWSLCRCSNLQIESVSFIIPHKITSSWNWGCIRSQNKISCKVLHKCANSRNTFRNQTNQCLIQNNTLTNMFDKINLRAKEKAIWSGSGTLIAF